MPFNQHNIDLKVKLKDAIVESFSSILPEDMPEEARQTTIAKLEEAGEKFADKMWEFMIGITFHTKVNYSDMGAWPDPVNFHNNHENASGFFIRSKLLVSNSMVDYVDI